jgi:hypothetical protein
MNDRIDPRHTAALGTARQVGYLRSNIGQAKLHMLWYTERDLASLPVIHIIKMSRYCSIRFMAWPDTWMVTNTSQVKIRCLALEFGAKIRGITPNWIRIDRLPENGAQFIAQQLATGVALVQAQKRAQQAAACEVT